jgi:ligand-binding sensor domain-containing protein
MRSYAVIAFLLLLQTAFGQSPYFQHYYLLRKNEPVQVNALLQDKAGFIWVGTDRGLFQFDGTNRKRFTRADSLGEDYVSAIGEDSTGQIWVGHRNGQISIINQGKVESFRPPEGNAIAEISDILFDRQGRLWFSTLNDGLYYYTHERLYRLDEADGMPDIFIYDLEEDAAGNIWAGTDGGVAICSVKEAKATIRVINDRVGLPDNIVRKFTKSASQQIWMASEDAGIFTFDSTSRKVKHLLKGPWTLGAIQDFVFVDDRVWIATARSGVVIADRALNVLAQHKPWKEVSGVNELWRDKEGNIWLGSRAGLARSFGDYVQFLEGEELGVKDQNILAIAIDQRSRIWFSTGEGLFVREVDPLGRATLTKPLTHSAFQSFTVVRLVCSLTSGDMCGPVFMAKVPFD